MVNDYDLSRTLPAVVVLTDGGLAARIGALELALVGNDALKASALAEGAELGDRAFAGALALKEASAQIDNLVHATGIVAALPWVLEAGETIEYVSLAAGSSGRPYDLATDRQVAEFKFNKWGPRGKNAVREGTLFADVVALAEADTDRRRRLYVLGGARQLEFLTSGRGIASVCAKQQPTVLRLRQVHGDRYSTVGAYWADVSARVELVDLRELVPELGRTGPAWPITTERMRVSDARRRWPEAPVTWHAGWDVARDVVEAGLPALLITGDDAQLLVFAHAAHRQQYAVTSGWQPVGPAASRP